MRRQPPHVITSKTIRKNASSKLTTISRDDKKNNKGKSSSQSKMPSPSKIMMTVNNSNTHSHHQPSSSMKEQNGNNNNNDHEGQVVDTIDSSSDETEFEASTSSFNNVHSNDNTTNNNVFASMKLLQSKAMSHMGIIRNNEGAVVERAMRILLLTMRNMNGTDSLEETPQLQKAEPKSPTKKKKGKNNYQKNKKQSRKGADDDEKSLSPLVSSSSSSIAFGGKLSPVSRTTLLLSRHLRLKPHLLPFVLAFGLRFPLCSVMSSPSSSSSPSKHQGSNSYHHHDHLKWSLALQCLATVASSSSSSSSLLMSSCDQQDTHHLISLYRIQRQEEEEKKPNTNKPSSSSSSLSSLLRLSLNLRLTGVKDIDQLCFKYIPRFHLKQGLKYEFNLTKEQEDEIFKVNNNSSSHDESKKKEINNADSINKVNQQQCESPPSISNDSITSPLFLSFAEWKEIFTSIYSTITRLMDSRRRKMKLIKQDDDQTEIASSTEHLEASDYILEVKERVIDRFLNSLLLTTTMNTHHDKNNNQNTQLTSSLISSFAKLVIKLELLKKEFHQYDNSSSSSSSSTLLVEEEIQFTFAKLLSMFDSISSSSSSVLLLNDDDNDELLIRNSNHNNDTPPDWSSQILLEEVLARSALVEFSSASSSSSSLPDAPSWFVLGCSLSAPVSTARRFPETALLVASAAATVGRWRDAIHHLISVTEDMKMYKDVHQNNNNENSKSYSADVALFRSSSPASSESGWKHETMWNRYEVGQQQQAPAELLLKTAIIVSRMVSHDSTTTTTTSSSSFKRRTAHPFSTFYSKLCNHLGSFFSVSPEQQQEFLNYNNTTTTATTDSDDQKTPHIQKLQEKIHNDCDDLLLMKYPTNHLHRQQQQQQQDQENNNTQAPSSSSSRINNIGWLQSLKTFSRFFGGHNFPQSGYSFTRPGVKSLHQLCALAPVTVLQDYSSKLQCPFLAAVTTGVECLRHDMNPVLSLLSSSSLDEAGNGVVAAVQQQQQNARENKTVIHLQLRKQKQNHEDKILEILEKLVRGSHVLLFLSRFHAMNSKVDDRMMMMNNDQQSAATRRRFLPPQLIEFTFRRVVELCKVEQELKKNNNMMMNSSNDNNNENNDDDRKRHHRRNQMEKEFCGNIRKLHWLYTKPLFTTTTNSGRSDRNKDREPSPWTSERLRELGRQDEVKNNFSDKSNRNKSTSINHEQQQQHQHQLSPFITSRARAAIDKARGSLRLRFAAVALFDLCQVMNMVGTPRVRKDLIRYVLLAQQQPSMKKNSIITDGKKEDEDDSAATIDSSSSEIDDLLSSNEESTDQKSSPSAVTSSISKDDLVRAERALHSIAVNMFRSLVKNNTQLFHHQQQQQSQDVVHQKDMNQHDEDDRDPEYRRIASLILVETKRYDSDDDSDIIIKTNTNNIDQSVSSSPPPFSSWQKALQLLLAPHHSRGMMPHLPKRLWYEALLTASSVSQSSSEKKTNVINNNSNTNENFLRLKPNSSCWESALKIIQEVEDQKQEQSCGTNSSAAVVVSDEYLFRCLKTGMDRKLIYRMFHWSNKDAGLTDVGKEMMAQQDIWRERGTKQKGSRQQQQGRGEKRRRNDDEKLKSQQSALMRRKQQMKVEKKTSDDDLWEQIGKGSQ